jgi:hypothetical protein
MKLLFVEVGLKGDLLEACVMLYDGYRLPDDVEKVDLA